VLSWESVDPRVEPSFKIGFIQLGEAIGEEGNGTTSLEALIHEADQRVVVATHMVSTGSLGIWNHQIKVKDVVLVIRAQLVGPGGSFGYMWGLGRRGGH